MEYKYVSADLHWDPMWLPKDLWQDRLPAHLKSIGPKVVETDAGTKWVWEDTVQYASADGKDNPKYLKLLVDRGIPAPEGSLPPTDPQLLLQMMDESATLAAVFFSKPANWTMKDRELHLAMYRAYNDWALEQSSFAPARLFGLPTLPAKFPEECVAEVRRVAKMGARAVEFGIYDAGIPIYDAGWDPLWSVLEEEGIMLCCHIGPRPGFIHPPADRGLNAAYFGALPMVAAEPLGQLVMSAVFERHPGLKFCFAETRVGWLPFFMLWLDKQIYVRDLDPGTKLSMPPSEYIKRNVVMTFEDDAVAARLTADAWSGLADIAIWGSDYPHPQGLWGHGTEERLTSMFEDVPAAIKHRVMMEHAAELFHVPMPVAV